VLEVVKGICSAECRQMQRRNKVDGGRNYQGENEEFHTYEIFV
jgi:hypothetical protein